MSKKPSEMTDQELNDAVAIEVMGWHIEKVSYGYPDYWCTSERIPNQLGCISIIQYSDWNPTSDMSQCWEVEEKITHLNLPEKYARILYDFLPDTNKTIVFDILHAPARQRCEAMLMAVRSEK